PGSGWYPSSIRAGAKLGRISKQGDRYLRSLFTAGALAVIRYAKIYGTKHRPWLTALLARRPTKVAAPQPARRAFSLRYQEARGGPGHRTVGCARLRTVGDLSDRRRARFLDDLRRRTGSRQSGARSDCRAVCELVWRCACWRRAVRQYR